MDEAGLIAFAWDYLGLTLDPTWPRTRMMTHLMKAATDVVEY